MRISPKEIIKIKKYFQQKPEVVAVYLYGSCARGTANKFSDLDLGIVSRGVKDPVKFRVECINDLISLLNFEDIDVQNLRLDGSLLLNYQAIKEGKLIYEKNKADRVDFETKSLGLYFDFAPLIAQYYRSMEQRIRRNAYAS